MNAIGHVFDVYIDKRDGQKDGIAKRFPSQKFSPSTPAIAATPPAPTGSGGVVTPSQDPGLAAAPGARTPAARVVPAPAGLERR